MHFLAKEKGSLAGGCEAATRTPAVSATVRERYQAHTKHKRSLLWLKFRACSLAHRAMDSVKGVCTAADHALERFSVLPTYRLCPAKPS